MKKTQAKKTETLGEKHKGGRPPKYATLEELAEQIKLYLESCEKTRTLPNKAGLCVYLQITRETYNQYKDKPEFSDALKQTERYIENAWVQRLGGANATGAIFYLKNAFKEDYKDRHETDITSKGEQVLTYIPTRGAA